MNSLSEQNSFVCMGLTGELELKELGGEWQERGSIALEGQETEVRGNKRKPWGSFEM